MASQSQGIQQLLAAANVLQKKQSKKAKAGQGGSAGRIEKYRKERERQFREFEAKHMGSREDVAAKIEADTKRR
ncbi:unnamed protein product [Acanthoscelides obtectus]|uniref:Uncharacterized protein n=1 Tax=Acanthoscelides obtectus TaxID=200917 RepID=A0A9P0MGS5_ACAOB|nr:unnamed protein product [Acanthoscelides obtectus]CAK1658744.1 hypothetical protein AOBTE_LOCUS21100 [Acanthoscelides obtectus]